MSNKRRFIRYRFGSMTHLLSVVKTYLNRGYECINIESSVYDSPEYGPGLHRCEARFKLGNVIYVLLYKQEYQIKHSNMLKNHFHNVFDAFAPSESECVPQPYIIVSPSDVF